MSRKKRHHEEEHENHERWLISYADFITLLMIFFIIMYAISSMDMAKFRALKESYGHAVNMTTTDSPIQKDSPKKPPSQLTTSQADAIAAAVAATENTKQKIKAQLTQQISQMGLAQQVKVSADARGVVLLLTDRLLFTPGSSTITAAGGYLLKQLSPLLKSQQRPVVVEGHTDNQPISTAQFPSNWELSTSRATNVLRLLVTTGISDKNLAASGYADTHPRASNSTDSGRSSNRRVELIVVVSPESTRLGIAAGPPAADAKPGSTTSVGDTTAGSSSGSGQTTGTTSGGSGDAGQTGSGQSGTGQTAGGSSTKG